ncbi:MAG: hypothetical protein ABSG89_04655 [Bacteroidales bacterium]|jgi:hypothetical protein
MKKLIFILSFLPLAFIFGSWSGTGSKKGSAVVPSGMTSETPAAASGAAAPAEKKYGIKSGIVTFESTSMGMTFKAVLNFDDYGSREAEERYGFDNKVSEMTICDGTNRYSLVYKTKTAIKKGACNSGTAYRFDWNEASKAGPEYKVQKLANVKIAGKDCESFSLVSSGNTIVYAGWNNICLLIDQNTQLGKVTYKAVSIEENATIPPEKFKVPADFQVK